MKTALLEQKVRLKDLAAEDPRSQVEVFVQLLTGANFISVCIGFNWFLCGK